MQQPAVVEQLGGGVGALVVAGRHRRAADQQLADVALGQLLAGRRGRRCASPGRAPAVPSSGRRRTSALVVGVASSTGLATRSRSSTTRSTASHTMPRIGGGNVPPMATSAMPKAGNTRARPEAEAARPRRRTPRRRRGRPARRRSARCAGATGRGPACRRRARVASTHEKFGPGGGRAAGSRRSTPSSGPGGRGSPAARPARGRRPSVIGIAEAARPGPCRGTAAATTPSRRPRVELGRRATMASRLAPSTRSGIITPFGSLVEPLVYCRMTSRSGSGAGISSALGAGAARAGQHDVERARSAGRRAPARRTAASWSSISRSLASPWRMRARVRLDELLERAHAHRQRQHHRRRAGQPAALDGGDQRPAGRAEDGHVVAGRDAPGLEGGADGPGLVVELRPRTRSRPSGPVTEAPTSRMPVGWPRALEPADDGRGR